MMSDSAPAPQNTTLRFVVLYAFTILLIVAIFSAFRSTDEVAATSAASPEMISQGDSLNTTSTQLAAAEQQYKEELKRKEQTIAMLQSEIRMLDSIGRNAVPVTTVVSDGGEWRQKFAGVKANYDKLVSENQALTRSYQTLADDNRRLISQLRKTSPNQ